MSRKPQSKDEALEALDFIVNVLKEHEKDLDKLIGELGTVTEQIGVSGDLAGKVEKVEEKVSGLQNEISNLVTCLSSTPQGTAVSVKEVKPAENAQPAQVVQPVQHTQPAQTPIVQATSCRVHLLFCGASSGKISSTWPLKRKPCLSWLRKPKKRSRLTR